MAILDTRAKRILAALLTGLCVSLAVFPYADNNPSSMLRLGDLPGFYGFGRILLTGQGERLYDFNLQRDIQNTFWPSLSGSSLPTIYPPVVAVVMAPFSALPPILAHTILALLSFILLCFLARWRGGDKRVERFTLILFSVPTLVSIVAPQTTIVSLLFVLCCCHLLREGRELRAGFFAGLLFYKPQIGLPFSLVAASGSGPRFLLGIALAALAEYLLGALAFGGDWLVPWLQKIPQFSELRLSVEHAQLTAITGGLAPFNFSGSIARAIQLLLAVAAMGLFALAGWRARKDTDARDTLITFFLATSPVFLPQTNFYDLAIALFVVLTTARLETKYSLYGAIALVVLVNVCVSFRSSSLSLVPVAAILIAFYHLRNRARIAS